MKNVYVLGRYVCENSVRNFNSESDLFCTTYFSSKKGLHLFYLLIYLFIICIYYLFTDCKQVESDRISFSVFVFGVETGVFTGFVLFPKLLNDLFSVYAETDSDFVVSAEPKVATGQ